MASKNFCTKSETKIVNERLKNIQIDSVIIIKKNFYQCEYGHGDLVRSTKIRRSQFVFDVQILQYRNREIERKKTNWVIITIVKENIVDIQTNPLSCLEKHNICQIEIWQNFNILGPF